MTDDLAELHFQSYKEVKSWIDLWIASRRDRFFQHGIDTLPGTWEKLLPNSRQYFE